MSSTLISPDFPFVQEKYTPARRFIRDFLLRKIAFNLFTIRVKTIGLEENVPASGPTILMINHRGGLDPFVMLGAVHPRFLVPMSKIENFNIPVMGWMMKKYGSVPISRGQVDRTALQNMIDLLKGGNMVLLAPEGHRQEALGEAKDGVTYVAVKAGAMIVPVGLEGTREFVSNLKHLRLTRINIRFGKPFRFIAKTDERIPRDRLTQMTQEAMYQLAAMLPEPQRGVYSDLSKTTTQTIEFVK